MLKEEIQEDIKGTLKAGNSFTCNVLRMVLSAIQYAEKEHGTELSEEDTQKVLKREVKKRQDSIEQYTAVGREEAAALEKREMDLILAYLPKQMDEAEISSAVDEAITKTGASTLKQMGMVMKELTAAYGTSLDTKVASGLVKQKLGAI